MIINGPTRHSAAGKAAGSRFASLRLGRDLPASAIAKSPAIARVAALPAVAAKPSDAAGRARIKAVATSEHAVGRERQALELLQTSASAEEITGLLAKFPLDSGGVAGGAANPMLAALMRAGGKPL